jgi:diguanylate cyclase (GGDEF)-like protein/PAS domain S-box-containing protein
MEYNVPAQLIKALDLLLDVICVVDVEGKFIAISAACEQVFGYTQEELIGTPMLDLVFPDDRTRTLEAAAGVMQGIPLHNFENRYVRKDGRVVDIMWSASWSEADQVRLAVAREITQRKQAESMQRALYSISEAAHSAEDLADMLQSIHRIIADLLPTGSFIVALQDQHTGEMSFPYFTDEDDMTPVPSQWDTRILAAEVIRLDRALLLTPESTENWPKGMDTVAAGAPVDWLAIPLIASKHAIGALIVRSHSSVGRYNEQHKTLLQFVSTQIASNIERAQTNARLRYTAQYDLLTNLPNRTLFDDRLQVALAKAARERERLALLYIDLDNFKPVNDTFGHAVGDQLLQQVAKRIQSCVRESDTVSRIGGDEFIVLLYTIQAPLYALTIAEYIRAALNQPFTLQGRQLQIASSIGIASYPEHGGDQKHLTRNADAAMYAAKNNGGNQCVACAAE